MCVNSLNDRRHWRLEQAQKCWKIDGVPAISRANGIMMGQTRIELSGWKAVAVAAVILCVSAIRFSTRFPTVTDEGRETLRVWLVNDYEGRGPAALARMASDYRAGLPVHSPTPPAVAPHVELVSLSAHGSRDAMVVRSEVTVDGAPPPDGRSVRYLFLTTKVGGGWMVLAESDAFRYYEALLSLR